MPLEHQTLLRFLENLGLILLVLGIALSVLLRRRRGLPLFAASHAADGGEVSRPAAPERRGVDTSWVKPGDLVAAVLLIGWYYFNLLAATSGEPPADEVPQPVGPGAILLTSIINLSLLGLVLMTRVMDTGHRLGGLFGARSGEWGRCLAWVILGSVIAVPLVLGLNYLVRVHVLEPLFGPLGLQESVNLLGGDGGTSLKILLAAHACLVAPLVEEVVFRGFLYPVIKQLSSGLFAGLIVAWLFAGAHPNLAAFLPLMAFGLLLVLVYEKSQNLWVPIGIHALFNATNVAQILYFAGS